MGVKSQSEGDSDILNLNQVLENVGGDRELLQEIAVLFLEDSQERLSEIREAVQCRDGGLLQRAAHTLKGSVGHFGGLRVAHASLLLECRGRTSHWEGVERDLDILDTEMNRFRPMLQQISEEFR